MLVIKRENMRLIFSKPQNLLDLFGIQPHIRYKPKKSRCV